MLKKFYNNSIVDFILDICDTEDMITPKEMTKIIDDIIDKKRKNEL